MCSYNNNEKKSLKVHSTCCYCYFMTNRTFDSEDGDFIIEFESTVTQTDNYFYFGIINELFNKESSCFCCTTDNSNYIQCDGSIITNSIRSNNTDMAWRGNNVCLGMKVLLSQKQIYFYLKDGPEKGPFDIVGNSFRVVSAHCNTGNGTIDIVECKEYVD